MTDGVIKGDGTSRLAKASGWPETYEGFKALAESSGIPLDLIFNSSGWQQLPTFLNKANLLQDFTATLLGLDPADDPTVDEAFLNVFMTSINGGLLKIRVYETGTTTPISGVHITGATDLLGGDLYADANGLAVGMATSETSTLQVDTAYIDLAGQTIFSGATPAQQITEITLYATRASNPSGKIETFTTSAQKMFTNAVGRVDVHCVGAGAGGQSGSGSVSSSPIGASGIGGKGGGKGNSVYQTDVSFTPNELFSIAVGAGGNGGSSVSFTSSQYEGSGGVSANNGGNGGTTTCLGVSAGGGGINKTSNGYCHTSGPTTMDGSAGADRTDRQFGDSTLPIVGGGDGGGGGGGAYDGTISRTVTSDGGAGGAPNGGDGADGSATARYSGAPGYQGGGGGGGSGYARRDSYGNGTGGGGSGGKGGDGIAYVRWFYA